MSGQAATATVPLSPVDRVAAIPDAFTAAGSGQGQRRPLRGETEAVRSPAAPHLPAQHRPGRMVSDLVGGAHAGLIGDVVGPPQLLDGLSWHGLGEAQTAPRIGGGPHLSHHRLLQHGCVDTGAA